MELIAFLRDLANDIQTSMPYQESKRAVLLREAANKLESQQKDINELTDAAENLLLDLKNETQNHDEIMLISKDIDKLNELIAKHKPPEEKHDDQDAKD